MFAAILAIFALALDGTNVWQGRLIGETIKLARDEFNATHRPLIATGEGWFFAIDDPDYDHEE